MKKHLNLKRWTAVLLAIGLSLMFGTTAQALTLQESYYLQVLYPKLPKSTASYPAKLVINIPNRQGNTTLNGTCGMDASLTEEEMLAILKQALGAVGDYRELENAVKDKNTVSQLTEKLKFSPEDMDRIIKNLRELVGLGDIPGIFIPVSGPNTEALNGDLFHDYEVINDAFEFGEQAGDIFDILTGQGNLVDFLKPDLLPSIQDILYNGAKISWEEFKRDQQKYRDIATLYQAKQRLRLFYARVNTLVKDAQSEKGNWTIRIYEQKVVEDRYEPIYDLLVPYIWTADIELVKADGSAGNINGVYTGRFSVKCEVDLTEYDSRRHIMFADHMNRAPDYYPAMPGIARANGIVWSPVSVQVNSPSEDIVKLEQADLSVTLSLPPGVNRTIFELPLDVMAMQQTEFVSNEDFVMVIRGVEQTIRPSVETMTWTDIKETTSYYHHDHQVIVMPDGKTVETENEESGAIPADVRPYIRMTLVVDML